MKKCNKFVLVTGATSGIGNSIAIYLDKLGYNVLAVARNIEGLQKLKKQLKNNTVILSYDLSSTKNVEDLCKKLDEYDIEVFVNNAGAGVYGLFGDTSIYDEINIINLNVLSVHILTKYALIKMLKENKGYILNVASSSVFSNSGPLISTYYATKSYVYMLTKSIQSELSKVSRNISISVLCPGPVDTNFNKKLGIKFGVKPKDSSYVAIYAINQMFKRKKVIVPGMSNKLLAIFSRFIPNFLMDEVNYNIQKNKRKNS